MPVSQNLFGNRASVACAGWVLLLGFRGLSGKQVHILRILSLALMALLSASAVMLVPLHAVRAEALFTSAMPDWIMPAEVPLADPVLVDAVTNGVLTLLSDRQVRWDGEERQVFTREVRLITHAAGVAVAGQVTVTFAPEAETVILTRVQITRGAQVMELTETAVTRALSAEEALGRGIAAGQQVAEVVVPGLQVGDVVDVAYVRRQLPVVAGVNRAGAVALEGSEPAVLSRAVLNWPESWPIYISGWPARVGFAQETGAGVIRHIWTRQGHMPAPPEPYLPPGYSENTVIAYSAFPDWRAVTGALSAHYLGNYPLGAAWDTRLRAIQGESTIVEERAIAALRAVQNDVATLEGALSANGWLAQLPADVTAAGAGDAKAKALLLRSMLDKMGIEAYVALTSRTQSQTLDTLNPAFGALDHAIVKVVLNDAIFWMDPSARQEAGDIYSAVVPDIAAALPLSGADQGALETVEPGYSSGWATYVDETYNFTLLGVYLTVVTTHYGQAANAERRNAADAAAGGTGAGATEDFGLRYAGARKLGEVEIADDAMNNQFTVTERYVLPLSALGTDGVFVVQMDKRANRLPGDIGSGARVAPLHLGPLVTHSHVVSIRNAPVEVAPPYGASVFNDAYYFAFQGYAPEPGVLTLEWTFNQYLHEIPAEGAAQVLRDAAVIAENAQFALPLQR